MIWASWILLAVYALSLPVGIYRLDRPVKPSQMVTPGAAVFIAVMSLLLIGCVNIIGWNWATIIVAADLVYTILLGIYRINRVPKVRRFNAWFVFNFLENVAICVLIVVGSLMAHHG